MNILTRGSISKSVILACATLLAFGASAAPKTKSSDQCAPLISNNGAAAGVCNPVCEGVGMRFSGQWSNKRNHPPVAQCIADNKGESVCGCIAASDDQAPGDDQCDPLISSDAASVSLCLKQGKGKAQIKVP